MKLQRWPRVAVSLATLLVALGVSAAPPPTAPSLALTLGIQSVDITGATANGNVFILGWSISRESYSPNYAHTTGIRAASSAGALTYSPVGEIPTVSLWIAVD